jgi:hypothetical protein
MLIVQYQTMIGMIRPRTPVGAGEVAGSGTIVVLIVLTTIPRGLELVSIVTLIKVFALIV